MRVLTLCTITFLFLSPVSATPHQRATGNKYCTPSQSCWPTDFQWASLSTSVNGSLIKVTPWQAPCFTTPGPFNLLACEAVRLGYQDGTTRGDQVGTAQLDNWEYCYDNTGEVGDCTLDASIPQGQLEILPVTDRTCRLGRLSPYAIEVKSPAHVQAGIAFAKQHNLKIVVKNTGHEYLGRDTSPNSLMFWTHHLTDLEYVDDYKGWGQAIKMGAGATADMAYRYAALKGKDITLGAYGSVGVAGGFAQGGGHGPLQPKYGLAVDNILEFTIVTADGNVNVANANQNQDLYWALRGGGGGTWGVVTELVYRVYDSKPVVAVVKNLTINPLLTQKQKIDAIASFTKSQANYEVGWRKKGWSGYTFMSTSFILFSHFLSGGSLDDGFGDMANFSAELSEQVKAGIFLPPLLNLTIPFPNFDSCRELVFTVGESQTPVAYQQRLAGRLIPVSQYDNDTSRQQLSDAIGQAYGIAVNNDGISAADVPFRAGTSIQLYSTGPPPAQFGGPSGSDTGVNTAWRDSIWEVLLFGNTVQGISQAGRNTAASKISKAMDQVRQFGTGCYYSEADVLERNWQTAFFGDNYSRLLKVKRKWDPNNLFIVYKGIGYEGQEGQNSFNCYQQA